jgi:hypothetical protein
MVFSKVVSYPPGDLSLAMFCIGEQTSPPDNYWTYSNRNKVSILIMAISHEHHHLWQTRIHQVVVVLLLNIVFELRPPGANRSV